MVVGPQLSYHRLRTIEINGKMEIGIFFITFVKCSFEILFASYFEWWLSIDKLSCDKGIKFYRPIIVAPGYAFMPLGVRVQMQFVLIGVTELMRLLGSTSFFLFLN